MSDSFSSPESVPEKPDHKDSVPEKSDHEESGQESPIVVPPEGEDTPVIEDANAPESAAVDTVPEDDPAQLDPAARALETDEKSSSDGTTPEARARHAAVEEDHLGDADSIAEDEQPDEPATDDRESPAMQPATDAYRIAVELKKVETEVRQMLAEQDSKRKRKLSGTRRWQELEEDLIMWRFGSRFDESTLKRLRELVSRRHHLFRRLSYLSGTRPTWNS